MRRDLNDYEKYLIENNNLELEKWILNSIDFNTGYYLNIYGDKVYVLGYFYKENEEFCEDLYLSVIKAEENDLYMYIALFDCGEFVCFKNSADLFIPKSILETEDLDYDKCRYQLIGASYEYRCISILDRKTGLNYENSAGFEDSLESMMKVFMELVNCIESDKKSYSPEDMEVISSE